MKTTARATRATRSYKPVTPAKRVIARAAEQRVAQMVGGDTTAQNDVLDVLLTIGRRKHGIEVKAMIDNANAKITMHPESLADKVSFGQTQRTTLHTVVIDTATDRVYYRNGVGSFRLHTMTAVSGADHLLQLIQGR